MKSYYFDDFNVAEMIYHFCEDDKVYKDFEVRCQSEDLSLAEFVYKYHFRSFQAFCIKHYNVYVQPVRDDLV